MKSSSIEDCTAMLTSSPVLMMIHAELEKSIWGEIVEL